MKKFILASAMALSAVAAPAFAQDSAPASTNQGDGPTFAGPRAEIFGGWDRVGQRARAGGTTSRTHSSGATAGALAGYDMAIGNRFIAGAYGSYALSTAKSCTTGTPAAGQFGGCVKSGRQIEGGVRVGAKMGQKALIYAKGAYVNGQIQSTFGNGANYFRDSVNRDGWRGGAGVEYALNKHAYVKAEYDYTRFKSLNGADLGLTNTSVRYDRNQVLGGFGLRF